MPSFPSLLIILATVLRLVLSSPVPKPELSLVRRSESGPKIGGVNFPDPSIIFADGSWYAFATRNIGTSIHVQIASSPDFNTWTLLHDSNGAQMDALPNLPSWVHVGSNGDAQTWAPDVRVLADGSFVMYFSATTNANTAMHCVGAATSKSITGPYTPTSNSALICPLSQGGAIDAGGYNDNGNEYIVYKVDGNSMGHGGACGNDVAPYVPTPIMLQPVAADGVTLQGSPFELIDNNGAADQGIVEAPTLVKSGNYYFLLFSSGCYTTGNYNIEYAVSTSITGGYRRAASPLLNTGMYGLTAPGSGDISRDAQHFLFHANYNGGRAMFDALLTVNGQTLST